MGIPGFNNWFAAHHRHAYVSCANRNCDHVYIDMASILHSAMKKATDLPHFRRILFKRLDSVMAVASPKKSVMFALDGPAPLAKLLTQRNRRTKEISKSFDSLTAFTDSLTTKEQGKSAKSSAGQAKKAGLSTVGLTPGTTVMAEIERDLEFYICQRLRKWQHLEFELSGARVQGEGEHKIMKRINEAAGGKGSHVIVGNDADIILMSLMSPVKQLYILSQQTTGKGSRFSCISFDALNMLRSTDVASFSLAPNRASKLAGLGIDLVLVSMLAKGNDYLPAIRGLGGVANSLSLWKTYLKLRLSPRWLEQNMVVVNRQTQTATLNIDMLVELLKQSPGSGKSLPAPANLLPADAQRYAQGLVWVLNMFLQAECPDYRWTHDNEPPSVQQLIKGLQGLKSSPQPTSKKQQKTGPILPPVCALALIPRAGREVMPDAMRRLMDKGSPVADIFDNCSTCDRLAADNAKVAVEYMHLHARMQAIFPRNMRSGKQASKSKAKSKAVNVMPSSKKAKAATAEDLTTPASFEITTSDSDDAEVSDPEAADVLDPGDSEDDEDNGTVDWSKAQGLSRDQMQSKANQLRNRMNTLRHQREAHLDSEHPYKPFPIDRIEQAVAAIRPETMSPAQQELCHFGRSHSFTWMSDKKLAASSLKAFKAKAPAGISQVTPILNVVRKPIIERAQPVRPQKIAASHDQVMLHAYLQQHRQQQKRPRPAPHALPAKLWPLPRLQLPSRFGSMYAQKGFVRASPLRRSMLTRNIMHSLC